LAAAGPSGETLEVSAAASLHDAFRSIGTRFESHHPGVLVNLNFGGSQQLAAQIGQGAPCDLFASADQRNLEKIAYDPLSRRVFALNRLVIATPPDKREVVDFRSLSSAASIVLAARPVPAGGYALFALDKAGAVYGSAWRSSVDAKVVSEEQDVRQVLATIVLGEADAGIVYATDALSAGKKVRVVTIPPRFQPAIEYPLAIPKSSSQAGLAREFTKEVLGREGRRELVKYGFVVPNGH
jgi:molybdate transport system substrate-binding protein